MKVYLCLAIATLILLSTRSCSLPSFGRPPTPDPPYGVWVSEEPRIMLFLKPQYRLTEDGWPDYIGIYMLDGTETKVFVNFGNGLRFRLYHHNNLREDGGFSGPSLLVGGYRVVGYEIRYTLTPHFQELLGFKQLSFIV